MNPCPTHKQPYPTANAAWRVIQFLTRKAALKTHEYRGTEGGHAYPCPHCKQWHITRSSRPKQAKGRPQPWKEEARG